MSSRKEEKERLRREREEAERAASASESRRKRIAAVLGGVLAIAVAVIVVLAVTGGDDGPGGGDGPGNVNLPAQQVEDLQEAAQAAGCTVEEPEEEGNDHLPNDEASFDDYKSNPPTSGTHRPTPSQDGFYVAGRSPEPEAWVHSLEHGRVIFQYAPGTPQRRVDQLEKLMNEEFADQPSGFKTVVMENNTDMPFAVAGVAWGAYIGCERFDDAAFDALRAFREEYVTNSKAPEADFPWPMT